MRPQGAFVATPEERRVLHIFSNWFNILTIGALSSFGRAPRLHRGGDRFEPGRVHGPLIISLYVSLNKLGLL